MLTVAESYQALFANLGLTSVGKVSDFFLGSQPAGRERVAVRPKTLESAALPGGSLPVYFKQYQYSPPAWSFVGRRSKARCEFENYAVFRRLQVPAATPIAAGESRDPLGRLRSAFIVTQTIPNAVTLLEFMQGPGRQRSAAPVRAVRREVLRQLAVMVRAIHQAHFFHHDLVWRNVLVTQDAQGPKVWWIDCPRGGFVRWPGLRSRRQIKDLASLDKPAGRWCTRTERVWFVRAYLDRPRLDRAAKQLIRAALRYRRTRWPEDWDGN